MLEIKTVAIRLSGTYSVLLWNYDPFAISVEMAPPVLLDGGYHAHRDFYHTGGYETFEIEVEGHDRILFHKGNHGSESKGCVIIAESFVRLRGNVSIADSKHGFAEFIELTKDLKEFDILVSGRGQLEGVPA